MFLVWDGYGLGDAGSGVGNYGRNLAAELGRLGETPLVIFPEPEAALWPAGLTMARPLAAKFLPAKFLRLKPFWPSFVATEALRSAPPNGPRVLHGLSNFNLSTKRPTQFRTVLTVHDLIPLIAPESVSTALALQMRYLLPRAIDAADVVIAVSAWTKATIEERFPRARGKVVVVQNGARFAPVVRTAPPLQNKGETVRLLAVARDERYKQIDIYCKILRANQQLHGTLITNASGVERLRFEAHDLVSQGRLVVQTGLSASEYAAAFGAAHVFVHPSRFEGFGFPVAEAMSRGLPVVYQKGSAVDELMIPEVSVGLVPGAPISAWVAAIAATVLHAAAPTFAATLGKHVETLPTWESAARATRAVYFDV